MKIKILLNWRILIFYLIFISSGCSEDVGFFNEISIPKEFKLELDSIRIPPVLKYERRIVIDSNYLISLNIDSDTTFRVIDIDKFEYLGWFGIKGRGPREFSNLNISGFHAIDGGLMVTDLATVSKLTIPSGKINDNLEFEHRFNIPGQLISLNMAFMLNDTIICGTNLAKSKKELVYFNTKTKEIGSLVNYSNLVENVPKNARSHLYMKDVNGSAKQKRLVLAYRRFPFIKICDYDGNIIKEFFVKDGPTQKELKFEEGRLVNTFDLNSYYDSVVATDSFIYAFFRPSKLESKDGNNYERINVGKSWMHIFDWNGIPIAKIELEDWMSVWSPSSNDKYLYFVNSFKDDMLYRYSLKTVLN